jgi:tellurite resistance protein TehA-like permease
VTTEDRAATVGAGIRDLHPAYFAMAMATGVVSLACHFLGYSQVAKILFLVNLPVLGVLWILLILRVVLYPRAVLKDWSDHQRGAGYFTTVAGTAIMGTQFTIEKSAPQIGAVFWVVAFMLWIVFMYTIFTALTVREDKPTLENGINGGWLTAVVATQALSVLGGNVALALTVGREPALFAMLVLWLAGGMLYIWMISLIFYRYTFFRFLPTDLMPPYWINMGAMAISTLAGTVLVKNAAHSPLLLELLPFLKGFTLWYWATATWWIPMLLILAVWRHAIKRFPFTYDPLYWGAVFPIGMYTTCTFQLSEVFDLPFLIFVPRVLVLVAIAVWCLTFLGLLRHLRRLFI